MDSESWPNAEAAPQFFCELNLFLFMSNSTFFLWTRSVLFMSNSTVLIYVKLNCSYLFFKLRLFCVRRTQNFSCTSNSNGSYLRRTQRGYSAPSAGPSILHILTSWKVPSVALSSMHTLWRVPLFCTLHSVQERHCILYQESTLLCRLWTLHYSATLKYRCPY